MADSAADRRTRVGLRPETLLSSIVVVLLVSVLQRSVGFGRAVLFCRWLDADQLGMWEMAYGFLILAAPLTVLGLPGSFGRYLERYRQSGQLRLFLRRTAGWSFALAASSIGVLLWQRDLVAKLVFGSEDRVALATGVVVCLGLVILHHFYEAIFAGLRMFRVVSTMHFTHSMLFAGLSLGLLVWWRQEAASIVLGYGAACLVSVALVSVWAAIRLEQSPDEGARVRHRDFWPPLMRFAAWVWVTNLLTNVFSIIDRYMIVHCGGFTTAEALVQVGNYHTSTIVPVLLISVANLVVGAMTPHLSHEWEAGRRAAVGARLNLSLKLITLGDAGRRRRRACGSGRLLFRVAFEGKYQARPGRVAVDGRRVRVVLAAARGPARTCGARRSRTALRHHRWWWGWSPTSAFNLLLLPVWGLAGAVIATAVARRCSRCSRQLYVNHRAGMRCTRRPLLAGVRAGVASQVNPTTAAIATILLLGVLALASDCGAGSSRAKERDQITVALAERLGRVRPPFRRAV